MTDTPRDWADEAADAIITECYTNPDAPSPPEGPDGVWWCERIALALRAARRVPEGYVREGDVDMKWCNRDEFVSGRVDYLVTRTAAEAAKKGGE